MLEKRIEKKFADTVKKSGGIALKIVSPSFAGIPDRLVLLPGGRMCFVELKSPGKKPRPLQLSRCNKLKKLGFQVYVIDRMEQIDEVMEDLLRGETAPPQQQKKEADFH